MADTPDTTPPTTTHPDAALITAWRAYRDAAITMDTAGLRDDSAKMWALEARTNAAMETLTRAVPTTAAGAVAALRFVLDFTGESIEAAAAREDQIPAASEWTSDGYRALYGVIRALEAMDSPAM